MKELKFRVWEEREKVYDTWSYILDMSGNLFRNAYGALIGCDKKDYIVEQCTGLKDKNGKEIYENDVVQISGERASIVFDEKLASYMGCFSVKYRNQKVKTNDYIFAFCPDDIEVIGNIHETPELLGEEE